MKIQIIHVWSHPEYGGERKEVYTYDMKDAEKAEQKFKEIDEKCDHWSMHCSIGIIFNKDTP